MPRYGNASSRDWCRSARLIRKPSAHRKRRRMCFMSACPQTSRQRLLRMRHNRLLRELETDIDAVKLDGQDVPVKLKVFDSLFVPLAKWSMLLTGNYRCITPHEPQSIRDAVHDDLKRSQSIYEHVDAIARRLGADPKDQVPFEKYAKAAESLLKPSSAARAVASGAPFIERVDLLVKLISHQLGVPNPEIDRTVEIVDQKLNERIVAGGSGAT